MWLIPVIIVAIIVLAIVLRTIRSRRQLARRDRARAEFDVLREPLEKKFLAAAAATGKPRGLRWLASEFGDPVAFAIDRVSSDLIALVAVTIRFEAIEGGDMEDVEAVGNLRAATAVLVYRDHAWETEGRVVFNLSPQETLQRFHEALEPASM